ncbi:unnamed protein product, partial [Rotaria magnacalcarata]
MVFIVVMNYVKKKLDCTERFRLNYYLRQHFGQQSDEFNLAK